MSIRLEGVTFRYPGATEPALDDLTCSAPAGEVTWLYGSPGAGCSTALLVAAGLAPRYTGGTLELSAGGRIEVAGADPAAPAGREALRGRLAFVGPTPRLQLSGVAATVWEEVAFAPANLQWPRSRIADAVGQALDRLGIAHLAARAPGTLSGGETQRLALAAMAVLSPEVWLLDEPGAALDRDGAARLEALLRTEAARGASVLVASEDADAMLPVARRLVLLRQGRAVAAAEPAALLSHPVVIEQGPGSTAIGTLAAAAGMAPPWPLTVEAGLAAWR